MRLYRFNVFRFLRHVPVIYVDHPGAASLTQIYGTFNRAMLRLIPSLRPYAEPLTNAMVDFYTMSQEKFTLVSFSKVTWNNRNANSYNTNNYILNNIDWILSGYATPLHLFTSWNDTLGAGHMRSSTATRKPCRGRIGPNLGSWSSAPFPGYILKLKSFFFAD